MSYIGDTGKSLLAGAAFAALAGLLAAVACPMTTPAPAWAQDTDYEAPVTVVRERMAGASYGPYTDWKHYELHGHDDINLSLRLPGHWMSYRWVLWVSGPQACAFTAQDSDSRPQSHRLVQVGGGRTIDADNPSAYFEPWSSDIWIAQGPCSEHDIPECSGICR